MTKPTTFLRGRDLLIFEQYRVTREVEKFGRDERRRPRLGARETVPKRDWQAVLSGFLSPAAKTSPGCPQWQLLHLSVQNEGGGSACCQVADEVARREKRISFRVLPLGHEANEAELPRVVEETKCMSELVNTLRAHHELPDEFRPKKALQLFLMVIGVGCIALSGLCALLLDPLPAAVSRTHVLLLLAIGVMTVTANAAVAMSQRRPTPELGRAVAKSVGRLHARNDGLYGELVSRCAKRLCGFPTVIIIDEFSSLHRFTRDVIIKILEDDTLSTQCFFRLIVVEKSDNAILWKEMAARSILSHRNILRSLFMRLTPLTREARFKLCKAVGGDLNLVDSYLPLKILLQYERGADAVAGGSTGKPTRWEVLDVLRAGHTAENMQITYSDFESLCTRGALAAIGTARNYSPVTAEDVRRAISEGLKSVPGLTADGTIRLDLLRPVPRTDGALHFIWCRYWCRRARQETADLIELRLAAHHAERSTLERGILELDDARRLLPSFCEAAWIAITKCIMNTMFKDAARLTECMLRVQGWVKETKGSGYRVLLNTLELISARVLWHVGLVTGDRAGLVRTHPPAARETDGEHEVAPELRSILSWYVRLLGASEESIDRELRRLLAMDRHVPKEDRWLLIESLLLEASLHMQALGYSGAGKRSSIATDECGGSLPKHLDWGALAYWETLLETKSAFFLPEIRRHMCCLGIRLASQAGSLEGALDGLELLLATVSDEPGGRADDQRSLLLQAVNIEVRATALDICVRAAQPIDPPQFAPGPSTRYRYRGKVFPRGLRSSVSGILHELDIPDEALPEIQGAEMSVPGTLHELAQRLYRDLAVLWEDFGLPHRAAWAQVWRCRYMLRESDTDFLAPPGNDEFRGALDDASRIEGPVSYVLNLVGADVCRGMHDIEKGYLLRAAAQSWRLGAEPELVAMLTVRSLSGTTALGRSLYRELATSILAHLRVEENGSALWCKLVPDLRGMILCHLMHTFTMLEESEGFATCARLADRLDQQGEISSKLREQLSDIRLFGRLAVELSRANVDDADTWIARWTGAQNSAGHVAFLVQLWRRLSTVQREAAAALYVENIESSQDVDGQALLLDVMLPIDRQEHVLRLGPTAAKILNLKEAKLTFEQQRSFAELVDAFEHKAQLTDYIASRTCYILEREKSERLRDAMQAGDALAVVFVYYENFQYLNLRMASQDEEMASVLKIARPGSDDLLSLSSVPEMVIGAGREKFLCIEFFLLVRLLIYDRNELYDSLRTQANNVARRQLAEFFDTVLRSGDIDAETVSLIRSHREYVVGGLQGSHRLNEDPEQLVSL